MSLIDESKIIKSLRRRLVFRIFQVIVGEATQALKDIAGTRSFVFEAGDRTLPKRLPPSRSAISPGRAPGPFRIRGTTRLVREKDAREAGSTYLQM